MKKEHKKKLIAPSIAVLVCILYFVSMIAFNIFSYIYYNISVALCIVIAIFPLGAIGMLINVYILRVKEIKEGKEDDISKY